MERRAGVPGRGADARSFNQPIACLPEGVTPGHIGVGGHDRSAAKAAWLGMAIRRRAVVSAAGEEDAESPTSLPCPDGFDRPAALPHRIRPHPAGLAAAPPPVPRWLLPGRRRAGNSSHPRLSTA